MKYIEKKLVLILLMERIMPVVYFGLRKYNEIIKTLDNTLFICQSRSNNLPRESLNKSRYVR